MVGELEVVTPDGWTVPGADGEPRQARMIRVLERDHAAAVANTVSNALAFSRDAALRISARPGEASLIPESAADRALLASLSADGVMTEYRVTTSTRLSVEPEPDLIKALLDRPVALRLYNDSLWLPTAVGRCRDLWRVLESAWQMTDRDLLKAMGEYQPIADRGYTPADLKRLLVIRGKASHAQSKSGIDEVMNVERLATENEALLRSLVHEVIVTKKNWGSPDSAAQRIHPLARAAAWTAP